MAISILVNIFTTNILLRALGASDYGLYNVVGGAVAMLSFLSSNMVHTTQRFLNYAEGENDIENTKKVFNNSLIIHYAIAIFLILLLSILGFVFFNGILNIPADREFAAIIVYASFIFITTFSVTIVPYDAILNAHENMLVYSIISIFDILFKFAIALIVLFYNEDRLILYSILVALISCLIRYITKMYCKKKYIECRKEELRKYYDKKTIKSIAFFASWNLVNTASGMASQYGKNIAVNHFFGTVFNAALGIATQLSGVIMGVSTNMIKAITPILVKSEARKERQKMLNITYIGCRFSYLLFSIFCIPVFFYTEEILELWLTEVPEYTAIFCRLLIIALLIEQLVTFLYNSIAAQGNIKNYNIARIVVNIMPLISTIIMFAFGFPAYWAIINWIIWYSIGGGIVNLYFCKKNIGLSLMQYFQLVLLPCIGVTLFSIPLNISIINIATKFHISNIVCIITIIIASLPLYWFIGLNRIERKFILEYIYSRFNKKHKTSN